MCFLAETHKGLNGNLAAVYEYLKGQDDHGLEFIVYTKGDRRDRHSISTMLNIWKAISVSKYIFLDDLYESTSHMKAREGQEIVQLWHGAGAYKKFGHSRKDLHKQIGGRLRVHKGYKKYTKAIVSGSKIAWCYAEAFGMGMDKVHPLGCPRMDELFDAEYVKKTREKFLKNNPELKGKKIVLFAPTFRGTLVREADYDFDQANLNGLSERLGDDYVIITRWHPALKNNIKRGIAKIRKCDFGNSIMDYTDYSDVNDLLIACDVMVTDYSSIIFDYFPLDKPIVYFAYDKMEYAGDRGLYYDFDKYVYGDVAETFEELVDAISNETKDIEKRKEFYDLFLDSCDENSTGRVCELLFD